jgi:SAM-dependent methyltransferase
MKEDIVKHLICPKCSKELELAIEKSFSDRIEKGTLKCINCNKIFPIIDYIPRFVESELYVGSFGDEWNFYKDVKNSKSQISKSEMKNYLQLKTEDIEGKFVLEVGCGAGPYVDISAREYKAKHIIGIDLSRAVDAAYKNVGDLENVTIIQADLVYSLGVLHHTPNTEKAFKAISKFVKDGGGILSIWVYGYYWKRKIDAQQWLREHIFNKFNSKQLQLFAKFSANFLYYLYLIPVIGDGLRERLTIGMDKERDIRELNTFDMYSPKFVNYHYVDEVYEWFEEDGFKDIKPSRHIVEMKACSV